MFSKEMGIVSGRTVFVPWTKEFYIKYSFIDSFGLFTLFLRENSTDDTELFNFLSKPRV